MTVRWFICTHTRTRTRTRTASSVQHVQVLYLGPQVVCVQLGTYCGAGRSECDGVAGAVRHTSARERHKELEEMGPDRVQPFSPLAVSPTGTLVHLPFSSSCTKVVGLGTRKIVR